MIKSEITFLVLGANGFIGSHIVHELSKRDDIRVKAFDRFSSQLKFDIATNIEIIKGDIFNESDVAASLHEVDYVIHSFSATTPYISDTNPYLDMSENVMNNIKIFEKCVDLGVKKVAFISSGGAVYGTASEQGEVSEESVPLPVSPYGIGKLATEHYLEYFKRKKGLEYIVYRLTNPYGPGQATKHNQGVIPAFIDKILNNKAVTIYGDGSMSRDYIYIKDAVNMILGSIEVGALHSTYNIGSGIQTPLSGIVSTIESLTGKIAEVDYVEAPSTFLHKTPVSITRFTDEFGNVELTNLRDGLSKTLEPIRLKQK